MFVISGPGSGDYPVICANSLVTSSNIATTTEESDFPATNLANPSTSLKWRATDTATVYITVTAASETVDYFCVARHNFSSIGATLTLETSGAVVIVADFTVPNDGPLIIRFPTQTLSSGIRLKIANATDQPEAAYVSLGQVLVLQRKVYVGHEPITMSRVTNAVSALSESGEYQGRFILGQHSASEIAIQNLTPSYVRSYLDPFLEDALTNPFFFAWRPSSYPLETALCWFPSGSHPRPINQRSNGMMEITMPVIGITT
jgi:hypothetical protein